MRRIICTYILILLAALSAAGCSQTAQAVMVQTPISKASHTEIDEITEYKRLYMAIKPNPSLSGVKYETTIAASNVEQEQIFPERYTEMEGILTFRGNNYRDTAAWGSAVLQDKKLEKIWEFNTFSRSFGGGGGWTGQPAVIKWPESIRQIMNIEDKFKQMEDFTEVIFASLDGRVYFFELQSGEQSRAPIDTKNTIKGSVAIDPRGYPLLYVGQGINDSGKIGYKIFSLINSSQLFFLNGLDSFAYRRWGAFDSAPLINRDTDTLILGGENGLLYKIKLNTEFNPEKRFIAVTPEVDKYRYKIEGNSYQGIENSVAVYKDVVYFADNGGSIQAVDIKGLRPIWIVPKTDDTDATIVVNIENDIPYLYTGSEVDKQGSSGASIIRKINGLTGEVVGSAEYPCMSLLGDNPVNGGLLASPTIGKGSLSDNIIFTFARYGKFNKGLMVALDCRKGRELWRWEMPNYAWSSPVAIYDKEGKGYIVQGDSAGKVYLLDGKDGSILDVLQLNANIESSPVVFDNYMVIATRGMKVYGIKIR